MSNASTRSSLGNSIPLSNPTPEGDTIQHSRNRNERSATIWTSESQSYIAKEEKDDRVRNMGRKMDFRWVGPIEPQGFLKIFLRREGEMVSDFEDSVVETFREDLHSWAELSEDDFIPKLCEALNIIFTGRFVFVFTRLAMSMQDRDLHPDVTVYCFGNTPESTAVDADYRGTERGTRCDFSKCFMNFECKSGKSGVDAFEDNPGKFDRFAIETAEATKARGQLVGPLKYILNLQQRSWVYSVLISPLMARLVLYDRSGGIVTRRMDLTQLGDIKSFLCFLSRLCTEPSSTPAVDYTVKVARGIDPTFKQANSEDAADFHGWMRNSNDKVQPWKIDPDSDVIEVHDSKNRRYLFSAKPVVSPRLNLLSRGSRIFYGMDVVSRKEVVMKDTWRNDLPGFNRENDTYEKLKQDPAVEGLPEVLDAYDVVGQSTRVCLLDNRADIDAGWTPDAERIELAPHVHYRMFFKTVGRRLSLSWVSSRQLVEFVYQVTKTLWDAYDKKKILHQDISEGNVLITPEGKAILTDWEFCTDVPPLKLSRRSERTGTWQYMSAMLLLKRPPLGAPPGHALSDDLESCFYLLLRDVLLHLPVVGYVSRTEIEDLEEEIETIFNQTTYYFNQRRTSGGGAKESLFLNPYAKAIRIEGNPPLTQLIADARKFFNPRYHSDLYESEEGRALVRSKYKSAGEFLEIFERALNSPGWPSGEDKLKGLHDRIRDRQIQLKAFRDGELEVVAEWPVEEQENEHPQQENEHPQHANEPPQ